MKLLYFCTLAIFLPAVFFSCGSTPKEQPAAQGHLEDSYEADSSQAVTITLPPKKEKTFFSGIPEEAVAAVEDGSPQSLNQAYSLLRKGSETFEENEKILINIAQAFMSILWKQETSPFQTFEISSPNPYTGAVESARRGIYDESTGGKDFLTLVLPSLVLVTSDTRSDYYPKSLSSLSEALNLRPDSVVANYLLGMLYSRMEEYEKALPYFQKAFDSSHDTVETCCSLAECHFKLKNYDTSLTLAQSVLEKNPFFTPAIKLCAENSFALKKLEESEAFVGRVLQQEPENSYYVLFRAKILAEKGDYIRAASLLDVYALSNPDNREYLVLRTKVQKDWNKNMTAACTTIEKALSLYPEDTEILLTAAALAGETGARINGMTAGEIAQKILSKDGSNVEALKIQVNDFVSRKKWEEAYKTSSVLIKMKKIPQECIYTHIDICLSYGKKSEAWELASSVYEKNPKDENALQTYIKVLVATDRRTEALQLIEENLSGASSKMKSFFYYERSFLQTSENSVMVDLRSSLTANPRNKDALFRLYQIYFNKKEYRKAQYYLKQVVAISPADENLLQLNSELEKLLSK